MTGTFRIYRIRNWVSVHNQIAHDYQAQLLMRMAHLEFSCGEYVIRCKH